ncbi:TetR/AcrR family transcriptional regulator [Rathayibacter festucae]|uniref:TetR/AcrR family transcriptional regulator n=1 Tax=Rathayibacter festucae DSM 15932 TaxID=1328866 RepID=A0A3Q9UX10_9MICO|nr:TetR/AcrR family transcriptional regulator [Rathayibacter festucae]AZZ51807.1 TetR/AcrR family transcriptional regulator [Rathayibacter festucae DSM 15932]MCJ1700337.1 TetR/AcrR family transcriptional regulator [Rathayibacter festucae]
MSEQALRKDAEQNRRRLIEAGRELLAERGVEATLNDIAHRAGVGIGTAYRRFPHKQALFDAVFEQQIDELEDVLRTALADPDPWAGLVFYLERSVALQARDLGLAQAFSGRRLRPEQHDWERDRLAPLVNELISRARAEGVVRPDVTGTDLVFLQIGLIAIAEASPSASDSSLVTDEPSELYRRYLWLTLDSLRTHPHKSTPLPVRALSTDEAHRLLASRTEPARVADPLSSDREI